MTMEYFRYRLDQSREIVYRITKTVPAVEEIHEEEIHEEEIAEDSIDTTNEIPF